MTVNNFEVKEIIRLIFFALFGPFIILLDNWLIADEDLDSAIFDWFVFLAVSIIYYGIPALLIWGLVYHTTPTLIAIGFTAGLALFTVGIPWMLWKIVKMLAR